MSTTLSQFVLEIGTEELPARFLASVQQELVARFTKALEEANVPFGSITAMATPRRSALIIDGLALMQSESEELVPTPPSRGL